MNCFWVDRVYSEYIERCALEDLHASADDIDRQSIGLFSQHTGSAFVSVASALPSTAIVINRAIGLGLDRKTSQQEVESILSIYEKHQVNRYFVQVHPAHNPDTVDQWLLESNLKIGRGWQKFKRGRRAVVPSSSNLTVEEIDGKHGRVFAEILANAFDLGEAAIPWLAKIPGRRDWHVFMSFEGGEPAGVGALYVKDGIGWADFGATSPEFRRLGSQTALMAARLECALDLGCRSIFTCTGVNVPGDPQHSYSNILRAGFIESYIRQNYEPC